MDSSAKRGQPSRAPSTMTMCASAMCTLWPPLHSPFRTYDGVRAPGDCHQMTVSSPITTATRGTIREDPALTFQLQLHCN